MSRIHEALKKVEQERSGANGADRMPLVATVPRDGIPVEPSFSTPFTWDALLERCPAGKWSPDSTALFFDATERAGMEEFRTLRSRLYQIREKLALKKILITSAMDGEGKSFVAANLAQVMAQQHGQRTLLIDGDLRGAHLHQLLGARSTPGLADYLSGTCEELAVIQRGPMENLFFISVGNRASNPLELIANGRLNTLLGRVEPLFDWVIMDSSPAVPVSDAGLLANYCDGVLLVVRSSETQYDLAQRARNEFHGRNIVGVVLNGADAKASPYTRGEFQSS